MFRYPSKPVSLHKRFLKRAAKGVKCRGKQDAKGVFLNA